MRRLLYASFIILIAQSTHSALALAEALPDRCIPPVGSAVHRLGTAYGNILQKGQAQTDISTAHEAFQPAIGLGCDRQAIIRGIDCIVEKVKNTGAPPEEKDTILCTGKAISGEWPLIFSRIFAMDLRSRTVLYHGSATRVPNRITRHKARDGGGEGDEFERADGFHRPMFSIAGSG